MGINLLFILLCCTLLLWSVRKTSAAQGFGEELISNKLNFLQYKLDEIEQGMITTDHKMNLLQGQLANIERVMQEERDAAKRRDEWLQSEITAFEDNFKTRDDILKEVLSDLTTAINDQMNLTRIHLDLIGSDNLQKQQDETRMISRQSRLPVIYESCKEEPTKVSGVYAIQLQDESEKIISVYCEQSAYGGGWIVFQHRFNGEEDFYRNWVDYRDGFGSLDGEFWLGLENLHQLTSSRKHELIVEVKDSRGYKEYAYYDHFVIGDESEKFMLKIVGQYKRTTGDPRMKFTTKDEDNDRWIHGNCAVIKNGAWWYDSCGSSDLNGPYAKSRKQSIAMPPHRRTDSTLSLIYTRMMIRNVD